MTTKISPRLIEALSSYLDGQLAPKERAQLEAQIESNPDLRSALEGLRRARALLRSQRMVRAPRNFTLSPEMAGMREGARHNMSAFPVLRLASVMATIFFLILFVGDLATRSLQSAPLIGANEAQVPAPAEARGFGGGGGGGGGNGPAANVPPQEPAPALAMETTATPESAGKMFGNAPETLGAESLMVTPMAAAPLLAATPVPQAELSADQVASPSEEFRESEQPEGASTEPPTENTPAISPLPTSRTMLRVLQVLLALLAIGTAIAALILRRSSRI